MRGLRDKVVIVAGGVPGNIGGGTAQRLAEEGARVVIGDLNEAGAQALADQIKSAGGEAIGRALDISDESSFARLVEFAAGEYGRLDGLYNVAADLSAGNLGRDTDVLSVPIEVWQRTIDVTLSGYMYGIRHAMPVMIAGGGGSIVNTMSTAVWMAEPVRVSYSSTKAALAALTRHAATVGGKQGVRCNAVAPGTVLTEANLRSLPEEIRRQQLADLPSPRLGTPADIAAMIAFLLSDDAEWINGQTIVVDGGAVKL
jgi:NAD(P)-dependent dehydrogenase (short-subunit alcohol dehydrogenase family)